MTQSTIFSVRGVPLSECHVARRCPVIMSVSESGPPALSLPGFTLTLIWNLKQGSCVSDSAELTLPFVTEFVLCLLAGGERCGGPRRFGSTAGCVSVVQGLTRGRDVIYDECCLIIGQRRWYRHLVDHWHDSPAPTSSLYSVTSAVNITLTVNL